MNLFAVSLMCSFVVGWLAVAAGLAIHGPVAGLAVQVLATAALFMFVPWARLRSERRAPDVRSMRGTS